MVHQPQHTTDDAITAVTAATTSDWTDKLRSITILVLVLATLLANAGALCRDRRRRRTHRDGVPAAMYGAQAGRGGQALCRSLPARQSSLLSALYLSDLFVALACGLPEALWSLTRVPLVHPLLCHALRLLASLALFAAGWMVAGIGLDRLLLVALRPKSIAGRRVMMHRSAIICAAVWVLSALCSGLEVLFASLRESASVSLSSENHSASDEWPAASPSSGTSRTVPSTTRPSIRNASVSPGSCVPLRGLLCHLGAPASACSLLQLAFQATAQMLVPAATILICYSLLVFKIYTKLQHYTATSMGDIGGEIVRPGRRTSATVPAQPPRSLPTQAACRAGRAAGGGDGHGMRWSPLSGRARAGRALDASASSPSDADASGSSKTVRISDPQHSHENEGIREAQLRCVFVAALIVASFTLCWLPYCTMELLSGSGVMKVPSAASDWAYVLGLLNALLNPVVYTQYDFNTRFNWLRRSLYGSIKQQPRRRPSPSPDGMPHPIDQQPAHPAKHS